VGNFRLTISESPVANDECQGAISLQTDGSIQLGFTTRASVDTNVTTSCLEGDEVVTAPSVWYTFTGTGQELFVTTCHATDFDTKLSLYTSTSSGSSCGALDLDLQCVASNDDGSCGLQSNIYFDSLANQTYYVLVHAYLNETGTFGISVGNDENAYNDFCFDARRLIPNVPDSGDTIFASFDLNEASQCGDTTLTGPQVWYTVMGE
jgi:hypothetical protein